ncbi:protein OBERON 2 isoform X2 [Salvia divinorum]|uniref:Protein OBERON 2 isoform X2 n=1 Tax=Salvia divinorum TaxID=28513 RepID=A0ABD1FWT5_SALDI
MELYSQLHGVQEFPKSELEDCQLDALRKLQEIEHRLAEERLSAQKNYIINLYEQLERGIHLYPTARTYCMMQS